AVRQAAIRVGVRKARAQPLPLLLVLFSRGVRERDSAIRRIDDERRALVPGEPGTTLVPELVVGQDPALRPRRVSGARCPLYGIEQVAIQARVLRRFELGRLLRGQGVLPCQRLGTLQWRDRAEGEAALDVRLAVWCPRWRPGCALTRRWQWRQKGDGQEGGRHEKSIDHRNPPRTARSSVHLRCLRWLR